MRTRLFILAWGLSITLFAQVEIDNTLQLGTAPSGERQISGLAKPSEESNLSSLGSAAEGWVHWCNTQQVQGDTLQLKPNLPIGQRSNGLLLRFLADTMSLGDTWIGLDNGAAAQLLDKTGLVLSKGVFRKNELLQIQWKDSAFYLMNPPPTSCPPGYLRVNETLCIQRSDNTLTDWYAANDGCEKQGAGLCTFAEYIHACKSLDSDLTGLFDNWEWLDDTSDHTHTADQVGRYSCYSNRSRGATQQDLANFRCCYLLR